ncbi:MAG: hypothetical protein WDN45_05440 [Caulobacteraceae bacterium]
MVASSGLDLLDRTQDPDRRAIPAPGHPPGAGPGRRPDPPAPHLLAAQPAEDRGDRSRPPDRGACACFWNGRCART